MVTKNNFLFILSHLFISSIEVLFVIFPQYVYSYDISYYLIMSITLRPLFVCIIILFTSQGYLVSLCCWCIWMSEKLFQTRKNFPLLPKESIWYSMNIVSTEAPFLIWIQISHIRLYSLNDWYYQHFPLIVPR